MKKILSIISIVLCCVCSRADTNTFDLSTLEGYTESIRNYLFDIKTYLDQDYWDLLTEIQTSTYLIDSKLRDFGTIFLGNRDSVFTSILHSLQSSETNTVQALTYLRETSADVQSCLNYLVDVYYTLTSCNNWLYSIAQNAESLPRIEAYQSALSVIVSNINEHILAGINVSIPNTINVDVRNFPNFNPAWDYLSKTFQWSGQNFDSAWQEFFNPNSQDNTVQQASPMSIPATTTLAEYLEKLYTGINNSGRILNDSIIHACYLLEGSNTVSQAEQEEASDSVDSSVDNAPTKMEQVSSSIPTPSFGVDTSYIRRGLSFWDHVYNIQKPTSIVLRTSPSDGDLVSVPEIYIEIKLSDYPALDKLLEFCRAVFTWLWWVLSVFFLVWLFRRGFALYTMVMGMLGPKPVQASPSDAI